MKNITLSLMDKNKLISSFYLLVMAVIAPLGLNILEKYSNQNINSMLGFGLLLFCLVAILDILVGYTLKNVFINVNKEIATISMILRIVYAVYLLLILIYIYLGKTEPNLKYSQFNILWSYGLIVFGIHLIVLAYLIYKSKFISKILGVLVFISGFGYIFDTVVKIIQPNSTLEISIITFIGEVLLIFWFPINVIKNKRKIA